MADAKLTVTIDHTPHRVGDKDKELIIQIVSDKLATYDYTGRWRINTMQTAHHDKQREQFSVRSVTGVKGQQTRGIRFVIRTGNSRLECFTGVLVPPSGLDISRIYATLNTVDKPSYTTPSVGEKFFGKIASVRQDGITIRVLPNNPSKYQCVFCPAAEIAHAYIDDPRKHFLPDRYMLVQVINTDNDDKWLASRRVLTPTADEFNPMPTKRNRLELRKFMASEERFIFALTAFCLSIERHTTKESWKKSEVAGGIFMKDRHHACAPADLVNSEFRREMIKQFTTPTIKPVNTTRFDQIIKQLSAKGCIHIIRGDDQTIVAYCMLEKGYKRIGMQPPPLPEYYEHVPIPKPAEPVTVDKQIEIPTEPPINEQKIEETPMVAKSTAPLMVVKPTAPPSNGTALDAAMVQTTACQIREYKEKTRRLAEVEKLLEDYELLRMEREEIQEWLAQHAELPELIAALTAALKE